MLLFFVQALDILAFLEKYQICWHISKEAKKNQKIAFRSVVDSKMLKETGPGPRVDLSDYFFFLPKKSKNFADGSVLKNLLINIEKKANH